MLVPSLPSVRHCFGFTNCIVCANLLPPLSCLCSFSGPNASGSVTMFLSRLGDTPLLGKEHELRLARVLQKGSALLSVAAALRAQLGREPAPAEMAAEAGLPLEEAKLRLNNREEAKDLLLQYNLR